MNTNRRAVCCRAPQRAYLVRCWREGGGIAGEAAHWRFSAEEVLTRQPRRGFDDLEGLFRYLEAEMADGDDESHHTRWKREVAYQETQGGGNE